MQCNAHYTLGSGGLSDLGSAGGSLEGRFFFGGLDTFGTSGAAAGLTGSSLRLVPNIPFMSVLSGGMTLLLPHHTTNAS